MHPLVMLFGYFFKALQRRNADCLGVSGCEDSHVLFRHVFTHLSVMEPKDKIQRFMEYFIFLDGVLVEEEGTMDTYGLHLIEKFFRFYIRAEFSSFSLQTFSSHEHMGVFLE